MARELKVWNGRAGCCHKRNDPAWDGIQPFRGAYKIYAAAQSRADLSRLIQQYCGRDPGETEIRDYWNCGSWGHAKSGITPERGLWLVGGSPKDSPVRLI